MDENPYKAPVDDRERRRRLRYRIGIAILWVITIGFSCYIYLHPESLRKPAPAVAK